MSEFGKYEAPVVAVPLDWLKPDKVDRRERIATACLAALVSRPDACEAADSVLSREAIALADALILELDK